MTDETLPKRPSLARAVILALLLVLIDGLWLNQGLYSFVIAVGLLLIGVPRALLPKFKPVRRERLRNLGIYFGAVALVWTMNLLNNKLAESRADDLIAAIKAYHQANQQYPKTLRDLVPAYLPEVPRAKFALAFNGFTYVQSDSDALLMYVAHPPYGRTVYSFARNEWSSPD